MSDDLYDEQDTHEFTVTTATIITGPLDQILKDQSGFDLVIREGFINLEYTG